MPARNVLIQKKFALYNVEGACSVLETLTLRSPQSEPQTRASAGAQLEQACADLALARKALTELETIAEDLKKKWSA
ncbi:MAG: hypothetical protein AMXMBFR56_81770 [Polyangiaceae bacterium]